MIPLRILLATLLITVMLLGHAVAGALNPTLTTYLPPLIRAMAMRCDTLSRVRLHARTERGDVYQVICDEDTAFYRYRVTTTPDGRLLIRPWSE